MNGFDGEHKGPNLRRSRMGRRSDVLERTLPLAVNKGSVKVNHETQAC
jgi:hypothetical protein